MKRTTILAAIFTTLLFHSTVYASDTGVEAAVPVHSLSDEWKHQLMIYGWLAYPDGTATFQVPDGGGGEEDVESEFPDKLDLFLMATYRGEIDKFSLIFDGIYLGMSDSDARAIGLITQTDSSLDAWLGSLYGGYNLFNNRWIRFDAVGGIRYLNLSLKYKTTSKVDLLDREPSVRYELYDGVVGVDGAVHITQHIFVPYHFDIGAGSSDLTWRGSAGLGYGFEWGDILVSYRYLYYDLADSWLIEDVEFAGPLVGVNFRF